MDVANNPCDVPRLRCAVNDVVLVLILSPMGQLLTQTTQRSPMKNRVNNTQNIRSNRHTRNHAALNRCVLHEGHFPAFNVADSAISVGAACMILDELLRVRRS